MRALSYLEINTFCILIILLLFSCHMGNGDTRPNARFFRGLLISLIVYALLDMLCGLQENRIISPAPWVVEIMNVLFFYSAATISFLGFLYAECEFGDTWFHDRRRWFLFSLPLLIQLVTIPLSLYGKFYFYIDAQGRYTKGPLYPLLLVLCYGYLVVIGVRSLYALFQKSNYAHRSGYLSIASLVVFPLITGVIQALYTGISIACMGATLACVQVFVNLQQAQITIDPLTQINNRSKMLHYLDKCINRQKSGGDRKLATYMIDINDFKRINDQYGHLEGDTALILLAEILKQVASRFKGLISRFGGDEFFVVLEARDDEEVDRFRQEVLDALDAFNASSGKPYELTISMGLAYYDPALTSPDLIGAADQALYRNKRRNKRGEKGRGYFH